MAFTYNTKTLLVGTISVLSVGLLFYVIKVLLKQRSQINDIYNQLDTIHGFNESLAVSRSPAFLPQPAASTQHPVAFQPSPAQVQAVAPPQPSPAQVQAVAPPQVVAPTQTNPVDIFQDEMDKEIQQELNQIQLASS